MIQSPSGCVEPVNAAVMGPVMGYVDDSLSMRAHTRFVRSAMRSPLLSREHEQRLARAWRDEGDVAAKQELVEAHIRQVVSAAARFRAYGLPISDLMQEGMIGLLEATNRFDPDREIRFSTYAIWWIRSSIQDHVLRNWSLVRVGTTTAQKQLFFGLRRMREQIEKANGRPLDDSGRAEIARRVGTDIAMVQRMESRLGGPDRSLDLPQGEDGELDPMSRIVDHRPDPEAVTMAQIDGEVRSQWLHEAIGDLNEREQIIIRTRRLSDEGSTLAEIGEMLGISKERVRQIESRALDKLRTSILERADYPDDLLSEA